MEDWCAVCKKNSLDRQIKEPFNADLEHRKIGTVLFREQS